MVGGVGPPARSKLKVAAQVATETLHKGVAGTTHTFRTLPPGADKISLLTDTLEAELR